MINVTDKITCITRKYRKYFVKIWLTHDGQCHLFSPNGGWWVIFAPKIIILMDNSLKKIKVWTLDYSYQIRSDLMDDFSMQFKLINAVINTDGAQQPLHISHIFHDS